MVDVLLTLCVNETDVENRVLLATCFGEVGAIAAHRLEDVKDFSKTGQRFADPPWHSTPHQYLLHILSHHLVTALQAAHSLDDQNKIAFSIQQVLALLNASAKEGYLDARSEIEPIRETTNLSRRSKLRTSTISDAHMGESSMMEPSLKLKLENDNILDFVEPFWFSSFREVSEEVGMYNTQQQIMLMLCFSFT